MFLHPNPVNRSEKRIKMNSTGYVNSTGYAKLEKNLVDIIEEQQIKLGYCREDVRLYYPLSSLNHFFETTDDAQAMLDRLSSLPDDFRSKLGDVKVTQINGRFCFLIPKEGSKYVHENIAPDGFLSELIAYVGGLDCTMQGIFDLFHRYSKNVVIEKAKNDEFDYVVHFDYGAGGAHPQSFLVTTTPTFQVKLLPAADRRGAVCRFFCARKFRGTLPIFLSRASRAAGGPQ